MKPSTRVTRFRTVSASSLEVQVASALALSDDDKVYAIERLRLADGTPVIDEQRFVVASHCQGLKRSDVNGSLYRVWTESFDLTITGADETIGAVAVTKSEAERLNVRPKSPALEVIAVGYINDDIPLWWERTLYRADVYQFQNRIAGLRQSGPAVGKLVNIGDRK